MLVPLLVAICSSTVCSVLLAIIEGRLTHANAAAALLVGALAGMGSVRRPKILQLKLTLWDTFVLAVFCLFTLKAFCWLIYFSDDEIRFLTSNNLGDLSLHITYINYLAKGAKFWPDNPIFAGIPLHYPLGMDLFNALLVLMGMSVDRSLIWAGLVCGLLTGMALWRWGKSFAIAGFLFNGGLAGWLFFKRFRIADYDDAMAWKSIPLSMFVTQRGLLYALPAGLVLLASWREKWFKPGGQNYKLPFTIELLVFSTLPLFHVHTFLVLGILLAVWAVTDAGMSRKGAAMLLASALVPATFFVSLVTGLFRPDSTSMSRVIHLTAGWMQGKEAFLPFWFMNFGVLPLLVGVLVYLIVKKCQVSCEARAAAAFVIPSVAIFLCSCFVMLAPWDWDNTKVMIWCYLILLPFLWEIVIGKLPLACKALSCFLLFFSGFISLCAGMGRPHSDYVLATRSELDGVIHATQRINVDETLAAYPTYNHPLLLCGHKLVEGYDGHLFSHGIDYKPRLAELEALMDGETSWRATVRALHVRYLFWGSREQEHYPDSLQPWQKECPIFASGSWGKIYDFSGIDQLKD